MAYVVLIHATFDTKSDADFIYDQAKQVATTASVARIGSAGERTTAYQYSVQDNVWGLI
jgi:hypothetical protein